MCVCVCVCGGAVSGIVCLLWRVEGGGRDGLLSGVWLAVASDKGKVRSLVNKTSISVYQFTCSVPQPCSRFPLTNKLTR